MNKNFLFYFIHPAKFHAFRIVINYLKSRGHNVDIAIISKDILEDLVKEEGWEYTNIFPEGRRIKYLHTYLSATINLFKTLYRLFKFFKGKKYDLIITDDLATFIGRIKGIPVIFFTDDDLKAVPESVILVASANFVLCPYITYMGLFSYKKLGYLGLKSLAHLHPNYFSPDINKINSDLRPYVKNYFFIRCVSATSTHDVGNKGLSDELLIKIINYLNDKGKVIINTQRTLPQELKKYVYPIEKMNIAHYLSFAKIFISDSTTMCVEAAVLGTPSIEIDDWFEDFEQYKLLSEKYKLLKGFYPQEENKIFNFIDELLNNQNLENDFQIRRKAFLNDHIDITKFMIWLLENFPESVKDLRNNIENQKQFF
ncbi:MAG: hypothetical protein NUV92_05500 [Ignavibacteria bacterium]|jgi:predicted glycosyltransferase|nr:hypothetical protein [Ignavibacteria bacterium]MDH7527479.1 hypothetical protein [Ignavibacteria bacterium]